jgi:hypothetical protein
MQREVAMVPLGLLLATDSVSALSPPHTQVASVMGMTVTLGLLLAIHPMQTSEEALEKDLGDLCAAHFLRPDDEAATTWAWCQVMHGP